MLKRSLRLMMAGAVALTSFGVAFSGVRAQTEVDCSYGGTIKAIEAVDAATVKFTLCQPDPAFAVKAAFSAFAIHSSAQLESTGGGGAELLDAPIGTGPYRLERWNKGSEIVFTANADYWDGAPKEATLIYRWNAEGTARWSELQAGTVDVIDNVAPGDIEAVQNNPAYKLYPRQAVNIAYLGLNNTIKPFDNEKIRQGISYAIDKQRIIDNFYPFGSTVANQFMPPPIFGYSEGFAGFGYDPVKARQLIEEGAAEAGVTLPIQTTLSYRDVVRGYLAQPGVVAQDLQAQLREVGIEVTIDVQESGTFLDNADAGKLSLHLLGWSADFPDATNFLDYHFGKGASDQFGAKNDELTALLDEASKLSDQAERLTIYARANEIVRDFVPMVPIANGGSALAAKAEVTGVYTGTFAAEQFRVFENPSAEQLVFMQNAEPISLYCPDETDGESLRACEQVLESLTSYELGGGGVRPGLATEWSANEDLTEWTFKLRQGVKFHDGSDFDATDVVVSWTAIWDAASPLHVGRTGEFAYFSALFGAFLNVPTATPEATTDATMSMDMTMEATMDGTMSMDMTMEATMSATMDMTMAATP